MRFFSLLIESAGTLSDCLETLQSLEESGYLFIFVYLFIFFLHWDAARYDNG